MFRIKTFVFLGQLFSDVGLGRRAGLPPESKEQLKQRILQPLQLNKRPGSAGSDRQRQQQPVDSVIKCPSVRALQESVLRIFSSVLGIFDNRQGQHLQLTRQMLVKYLEPSPDPEVRFQEVRAIGEFKRRTFNGSLAICCPG